MNCSRMRNDNVSVGHFDHVIFACHSPQALQILNTNDGKAGIDPDDLLAALNTVEYGDKFTWTLT